MSMKQPVMSQASVSLNNVLSLVLKRVTTVNKSLSMICYTEGKDGKFMHIDLIN